MKKALIFALCICPMITSLGLAAARSASDYVSASSFDNMYPAMNNRMRVALNPGTIPGISQNPVSAYTHVKNAGTRRVVARTNARSATPVNTNNFNATTARAGMMPGNYAPAPQPRRVVARDASRGLRTYSQTRTEPVVAPNVSGSTTESISSSRCLADYTQCMNGYCERAKTAYNRCYCSSKLAQIDSQYQPAIDSLIRKIIELQGGGTWTQDEMNDYWDSMIGQHTGDNSWKNLEGALDIDWADTDSRVRGQQAFLTGHEYCMQHLQACYYMGNNLRDAYRSDIARDCAVYERGLQRIKNAAESIVDQYD